MKKIFIFSCFILFLFTMCETPIGIRLPNSENATIIEGWIENEKYPIVVVSKSLSYYSEIGMNEILSAVDKSANVYVTDEDGNTEHLELGFTLDHIFGAVGAAYIGKNLLGQAGKEYTLYVEDKNGNIYTSKTKIPENTVQVDSLFFPINSNTYDTMFPIRINFTDKPETYDCYRFFCKIANIDVTYSPIRLGTFDDLTFNGKEITYELSRSSLSNLYLSDMTDSALIDYYRSYFKQGDTVIIRSTLTDTATFKYWFPLQVDTYLGMNPFMIAGTYPTNISGENVSGIWSGYHARYDTLIFE